MSEKQINLPTQDGELDAWVFQPDGEGTWPAVILHTDIRGVRPVFIEKGRQLAAQGYVVLLPNLYYRTDRAPVVDAALVPGTDAAKARYAALRAGLSAQGLQRDHAALLAWLGAHPRVAGEAVGIAGYCLSGAIALHAAADYPARIAAVASFHGGNLATTAADSPHLRADAIRARLHFGHAQDDASMPEADIGRLEAALVAASVEHTATRYPARHGFAVADNPAHHAESEVRHWQELLGLFEATLKVAA